MNPNHDRISEIDNSVDRNWNLVVGVFRIWYTTASDTQHFPISIEVIFIDNEGNKIHATVPRTLIYKFYTDLNEGSVYNINNFDVATNIGSYRTTRHNYRLNFKFSTQIRSVINFNIPMNVIHFTQPTDCFADDFDSNYLVDIIGVLIGIGETSFVEFAGIKTRVVVLELDNNGFCLNYTLYGPYVEELSNFIDSSNGINPIIALTFSKFKVIKGKGVLSNTRNASILLINPEHPTADNLRIMMENNLQYRNMAVRRLNQTSIGWLIENFVRNLRRMAIN